MNLKDGFDFNEILWSFLDQSRRWGQELATVTTLYRYPGDPLPSLSCIEMVIGERVEGVPVYFK